MSDAPAQGKPLTRERALEVARKVNPYLGHSWTFSGNDLLCYYAGFNLSEFARQLLAAHRPSPMENVAPDDAEDRMVKVEKLIAELQSIKDRFGNTCVYIRRGGLSWGAVALNRRDDDQKHGVFDLQAQHDRDMLARLEQIERLKKDRDEWRQKVWGAEAASRSPTASDTERQP